MKTKLLILLALSMASIGMSGEISQMGNPTFVPEVNAFELSLKPQYAFGNDSHDGHYGAEIQVGYLLSDVFTVQLAAGYISTDSEIQNYSVDLKANYPDTIFGVSPYVLIGSGIHTNSDTGYLTRLGAGVNWQIWENTSLFVEGIYNIVASDIEDYTTLGVGVRFQF